MVGNMLTENDLKLCREIFEAAKRLAKPIMSELIYLGLKYPELKTEVDRTLSAARAERLMEKLTEIDKKLQRTLRNVFEYRASDNELRGSGGGR